MKKNIFHIIGFSFIYMALSGIVNLYADELRMINKLERNRSEKYDFLNRLQTNHQNKTVFTSENSDLMYNIQTKRIHSSTINNRVETYKQTEYSDSNVIGLSDYIKSTNSRGLMDILGFDGTVNIVNIGINAPVPYLKRFRMRINRIDIDM